MIYTLEELHRISSNMQRYGGSFANAIGMAMERADQNNLIRLTKAFPELMDNYNKIYNND